MDINSFVLSDWLVEGLVKQNRYILSFKFRFVEYDMCKASDKHF